MHLRSARLCPFLAQLDSIELAILLSKPAPFNEYHPYRHPHSALVPPAAPRYTGGSFVMISTLQWKDFCVLFPIQRADIGGVFNLTLLLVGATHRPAVHVGHASLGDSNAAAGERPHGLRAATPRPRALTDCGSCTLHMRTNVASPMHALPAYRPARDCSPAQAKTRLCSAQVLNRPWSPRSSCLASLTQWLRTGAVVELQRRPAGARLRELCGTVGNKTTRDFAQSLTNSWFIS